MTTTRRSRSCSRTPTAPARCPRKSLADARRRRRRRADPGRPRRARSTTSPRARSCCVTMMPDDSQSIAGAGNTDAVRDGHNFVLDALGSSKQVGRGARAHALPQRLRAVPVHRARARGEDDDGELQPAPRHAALRPDRRRARHRDREGAGARAGRHRGAHRHADHHRRRRLRLDALQAGRRQGDRRPTCSRRRTTSSRRWASATARPTSRRCSARWASRIAGSSRPATAPREIRRAFAGVLAVRGARVAGRAARRVRN